MTGRGRRASAYEMVAWAALVLSLLCVVVWGRIDRATARNIATTGRPTVAVRPALVVPGGAGPIVEAIPREQASELNLRIAEERARETRDELKKVNAALEVTQQDLRRLKEATDANAERTQRETKQTSLELERQRESLEVALKQAEAKLAAAKDERAQANDAQQRRLRVVAAEGVARALRSNELLDFKIRHDARRLRDPALKPFEANQAAVAAAGAGGGGGFGGGGPPGSTVAGDTARGYAAMAAAQGEANLRNSQAAINAQTATAMGIENRLRWTETYFEMRRINRAARAFEAGPRITSDQAIRMAIMQRPPRLSQTELDAVTGDIAWPVVLTDPAYDHSTKAIEDCFRARAQAGGYVTFEQTEMLGKTISELLGQLKSNVAKYAAGKYGKARTFLDSLRQEFEMPLD